MCNDVEGFAAYWSLMSEAAFRPVNGATTMFEILHDGESIGITWRRGDEWFADKSSMSAPAVRGTTRDEAAMKLIAVRDE